MTFKTESGEIIKCRIGGCEGKIRTIKSMLCQKHWLRKKNTGGLIGNKMRTPPGLPMKWLKQQISTANKTDCIIWKFCKDKGGYGCLVFEGAGTTASRVALILATEQNPEDKIACHKECNNRSCVNPHHLYWGTYEQNQEDKIRDNTHNQGERQYSSKLTTQNVLEIREKRKQGIANHQIAKDYGISQSHAYNICNGTKWTWLE